MKRAWVVFLLALLGGWWTGSYEASHHGHTVTPVTAPCYLFAGPHGVETGTASHHNVIASDDYMFGLPNGLPIKCVHGSWRIQ